MKALKKIAVVCLAVLMALACVGCSSVATLFEDKDLRANTETVLDAVIEDDFDTAYAVVADVCTEENFETVFSQMKVALADVKTYELTALSASQNSTVSGGKTVKTAAASYKMTTNADTYIVDVQMTSEYQGLSAFYISPYEETNTESTGAIENMKGASAFQWIMLISNVVMIGIAVFAFVDCCRKKIKNKALWLIIIAVGFAAVAVTVGESGFNLNFNIGWLLNYSAYIVYGDGTKLFRLMLPVGAIVYLAMRNGMVREELVRQKAAEQNSAAEQSTNNS